MPPKRTVKNEIYQLALVKNYSITLPDRKEPITPPSSASRDKEAPPVVLHEPAILVTTRQVRSEASAVFYGGNRFSERYALYGPKLPANRLFEAADSYLNAEAALMPVGHGASGGFLRVKDHEEFGFVEGKELPTVAWIEAQARNPVFSIFDV